MDRDQTGAWLEKRLSDWLSIMNLGHGLRKWDGCEAHCKDERNLRAT